jgi:hypothetical protein
MKLRLLIFGLIFTFAATLMVGCNLPIGPYSSNLPQTETPSLHLPGQNNTSTPTLTNTALAGVKTPIAQATPTKSHKISWGRYWCFDCMSDSLIKDLDVMGGVPPISFVHDVISVTLDKDGNVTTGSAHFSIGTNIGSNSENCGTGDFEFDTDNGTGFYDIENHRISMDYTGERSYSPMGNTEKCGNRVSGGTITLHYIFMVQEKPPALILCLPGETGDACLSNPMAILDT